MMNFDVLKQQLEGDFFTDETTRRLYATDASAYREIPQAVAIPRSDDDIEKIIRFANEHGTSVIPRTAGTSLAGQVVGGGIVVDISKHFNKIIEINAEEGWAKVQPGIVRDDLNKHLKEHGYFFAPETSTANRAMIGGMIGNNSCGSNSVVYGSTREHLIEVDAILSDGSRTSFGELDQNAFTAKANGMHTSGDLETNLYLSIREMLSDAKNIEAIEADFPKSSVPRRNTGYAIDMLANMVPFKTDGKNFNFCELIAGSEGTLAFVTAAKIKLTPIAPPHKRLVCIHCNSIDESLHANLVALKYKPTACELMDHFILEATERNLTYRDYRFFVEGEPKAILVAELTLETEEQADITASALVEDLKNNQLGYAYPIVTGDDIKKVWGLRKAGLGLLSNVVGDAKPAPVIEDTAVDVNDLPAYIAEFNEILKKHNLTCVHYAHAGSGELHLRPILDLKTEEGVRQFRVIAEEIAQLVKKYKGSLSGEHGDGRLRGEFIPQMLGEHNYQLIKQVKETWDPNNIMNPGKIVNTPPMDTSLRYEKNQQTREFDTMLDFSETLGYLRAAEQCNGSGDCRKTELSGGTMCPSYMATRNEKETTRGRANVLREMLTRSDQANPFAHEEIKEVMDLCLSCKGCKSECPSNVDMGKLKQEWQYQYYKEKGVPFRNRLIGNFSKSMKLASLAPWGYKLTFSNKLTSTLAKSVIGFAQKRSMPELSKVTWEKWFKKQFQPTVIKPKKTVYIFIDELINYSEAEIGITTVKLLDKLGYKVVYLQHEESGRSFLSKGLLDQAKKLAQKNIALYRDHITAETPLIGVEPSAILTFRDEYPDLLRGEEKEAANSIAQHTYMIEEFLAKELDAGNIDLELFEEQKSLIKLHGHCQQKALSSLTPVKKILTKMGSNEVHMIPSGCCGMAGSFGYEKEHFDLSMKIGELVLFPTVRKQPEDVIIAAAGTSCRHQIKDGTARKAKHPVEIIWEAMK
ncbi:FAD-binding and (Fe-S)-binding domain-containing protein [Marinoscillum furvescens]|uniref:FAD/FMN-containing dehydrogenase n=1 Tax=Marinoscillum furvescens DSM 4134 TaxID=1122208 RepID=A0A3D9L7U9_MARFU|nr:FAD-binding and (Fe-S)-binding domain-containing protein [Marinoscillum furvescens]REE00557.1 FAD/FMN-containing dehydrogenase [Marinoscillum furvescens DSM 4134]